MTYAPILRAVGSALMAVAVAGCGQRVELMAGLPAAEANEIMAALQNAGLDIEKIPGKEGLSAVTIPSSDVGRAVDLLREKGLPRERYAGMGQVFKKEGLISSPLEERARYLYALSQELGATLSQIDGVVTARVHVVLPERAAVGEVPVPSSAAVFIKHQEGYNMETVQPLVRRLVSHSIPGLAPEKVSIVLVSTAPLRSRPDAASMGHWPSGAVALTGVLGFVVLLSLGGSGFLLWKYWWPARKAGGFSLKGG